MPSPTNNGKFDFPQSPPFHRNEAYFHVDMFMSLSVSRMLGTQLKADRSPEFMDLQIDLPNSKILRDSNLLCQVVQVHGFGHLLFQFYR